MKYSIRIIVIISLLLTTFFVHANIVNKKNVTLPIQNYANDPYRCFAIKVWDTQIRSYVNFSGKIVKIYYGFTDKTREEYLRNNDVPWYNRNREPIHEKVYDALHINNGSTTRSRISLLPLKILAPNGMNLVFTFNYSEFHGNCHYHTGNEWYENKHAKTYFLEVN